MIAFYEVDPTILNSNHMIGKYLLNENKVSQFVEV